MKTYTHLALFAALPFLLAACGEKNDQNDATQVFKNEFRLGFIEAASEQCVKNVPQNNVLPSETVKQICDCTAEQIVDKVSAEDVPDVLAGKVSPELRQKIAEATKSCAQKVLAKPAAASGEKAASSVKQK
ncbi:hypothetical protein [Neisseria chenwenguii]|uniref:Uncharacterized protein n=1 Tax=Neisseria chenwenguii TaxID=1853278 RepID=A0A220S016_9NEIS|nr:hypothetical protein [Neisseria chenwenguii]ASK26728.1 hypothetical protein BG910_02280 [Neisseria chenwenguii]ROV56390.1 hypothetical protein EGS38_05085 [Neisseria chenwenguii]